MKNLEYTAKNGSEIKITVTTNYLLDGQGRRKESGEKQVVVKLFVGGEEYLIFGTPVVKLSKPQGGAVAAIGNKVGLNQERYETVMKMIDEAKHSIKDHNEQLHSHAQKLDDLGSGDINELIAKNS